MGDEYTPGALTRAISKTSKKKKAKEKKPLEDLFAAPAIAIHFTPKDKKNSTTASLAKKSAVGSAESGEAISKKSPKSVKRKKLEDDSSDEESLSVNRKRHKQQIPRDPKEEERTVFVGNLPNNLSIKKLKKVFKKYGDVETIRIRSVAVADPEMPKKLAVIRRDFHPERKNMNAYVRFKTEEGAKAALKLNGNTLNGLCLRVDLASREKQHDYKSSVFLGNLPYSIEENIVHAHFEVCGDIHGVRVIRDSRTGIGKGFGYVQFQKSESVELALKLDGSQLFGREIRVSRAQKKPKVKPISSAQGESNQAKQTGTGRTLPPGADKITRRKFFSKISRANMELPKRSLQRNATMRIAKGLKKKKRKITN